MHRLKKFSKFSKSRRPLSYVPIDDHFFGLSDEEIELRATFRKFFEKEIPKDLAKK